MGVFRGSGVVSGTTVRALVLGPFSQKRNKKIELKDNTKKWIKIFQITSGWCFGRPMSAPASRIF